jgi:hypothetical protein
VEATLGARLLDARSVSWSVNSNFSTDRNRVVSLSPDANGLISNVGPVGTTIQSVIRPGYALNGFWALPIAGYADENHDGFIEGSEIRLGDSAVYLGSSEPNYQLNAATTLGLFNGRIVMNTAIGYVNGLTQVNRSADLLTRIYNDPHSTLSQQAAVVARKPCFAGDCPESGIGFVQTVSTLRWSSLSISWITPQTVARWLRSSQASVTLQGSNLGLHSNYSGKDPNVNAFSSGNLTSDNGQLPQPRTWSVRMDLR